MIAVVDYGAGNLHSVCNALELFGQNYQIVQAPDELNGAAKILLPGVGHFGQMMESLDRTGLADLIRVEALRGTQLLGICLGMQALYEESEEAPSISGLGLIPGRIVKFRNVARIPHMGWNDVSGKDYYFANSFYAPVGENSLAVCEYGRPFTAIVEKGCVTGFQFHPEKSGDAGLQLLRAWCEQC